MIRNKRDDDPDRDIDFDIDSGYVYTVGKECVVKFNIDGLVYADSANFNESVDAVRLSENKTRLYVLTNNININIINA